MAPQQPQNPRVVYPDGTVILINRVWYGARINKTHVWVSDDPQFVPWVPDVRIEYDNPDSNDPHYIVVGMDLKE